MRLILLLCCCILLLSCSREQSETFADIVLLDAKIVTMDSLQPRAEAIALLGGLIAAVGGNDEISALIGDSTTVLHLDGKLVIPGFIESHGHFMSLGRSKMRLELQGVSTWEEIVGMVRAAAARADSGEWISGRGWHQEKWLQAPVPQVEGLPINTALDEAAPFNPVILRHASGHAAIVNSAALQRAGISDDSPDPEGGTIVRDAEGHATGVLRENASMMVREAQMADEFDRSDEQKERDFQRALLLAREECWRNGVCSFHDAGVPKSDLERLIRIAASDTLGLRLYLMLTTPNAKLTAAAARHRSVSESASLTVRAVKRAIDGALGSHGAWLLEPYSDQPSTSGLNTEALADLRETARLCAELDLQLCVHAIGDRANREILNIYEEVLSALPDGRERRWRVEHAQHLAADDIPRFAQLGVIAAMQGIHCSSDAPWVIKRLGVDRAREGAYVWRSLLDHGTVIANGSDTPVEAVSPLASFYASISRKPAGQSAFFPEQAMSRDEALRSYTLHAAYAAFEDQVKGSLTPGKYADVVVLSDDILTIAPEGISQCRVLYTIVGGRIVYRADS